MSPLKENISNLTKLNHLTPNDFIHVNNNILNLLYKEKKSISEICILIHGNNEYNNRAQISKQFHRGDRGGIGLINDGLIEEVARQGNVTYYIATEQGRLFIDNLKELKRKQKEEQMMAEMEVIEIKDKIESYKDFLSIYYKNEIFDSKLKQSKILMIDFNKILNHNKDLADFILDDTEESIKCIEISLESLIIEKIKINIRIFNLPKTQIITPGKIRSEHIGTFMAVPVTIKGVGEIFSIIKKIKFQCPGCGTITSVMQGHKKTLKKINKCGCGWRGKFNIISKEQIDTQILMCEELNENIGLRTQPQNIISILTEDLTHEIHQHKYEVSEPMILNCIIMDEPLETKNSTESVHSKFILKVNSIEFGQDLKEITISKQEIKEIKDFSKQPKIIEIIANEISPSLAGLNLEKQGILLSAISGGGKFTTEVRDDSHCLLIGDPSTGKSKLMKDLKSFFPTSRYVSSRYITAVGLIGSVTKNDDLLGRPIFEKGALPMTNNGIVFGEEVDKLNQDDIDALHEPLDLQEVSVHKWNIHLNIKTDVTFIGCCNPKNGHFDRYESNIPSQLKFESSFLSRFDIMFVMRDIPNKKRDMEIAKKITTTHKNLGKIERNSLSHSFIKKYLHYCRNNINPVISDETADIFEPYFVDVRAKTENLDVNFASRQLHGLWRLAKASAKLRCSDITNEYDANLALKLVNYGLESLGVIKGGKVDMGIIMGMDPSEERKKLNAFEKIFNLLESNNGCDIEEINQKVEFDLDEKFINKLISTGDYYTPKPGFIMRLN